VARLVVAVMDGLQVQWLLDDELDMAAPIDLLLDLLARGSKPSNVPFSRRSGSDSGTDRREKRGRPAVQRTER
jgi:hypothetical protein